MRLTNSVLENNASGLDTGNRSGRGANVAATIYVRGAQPVIVENTFLNNDGDVLSFDLNSFSDDSVVDLGPSRGLLRSEDPVSGQTIVKAFEEYSDNRGPLVRRNSFADDDLDDGRTQVSGMSVRGEDGTTAAIAAANGTQPQLNAITTASVWDDTDIAHIVRDEIIVLNSQHGEGSLRLQSDADSSLVIKLDGDNAGFTASGSPLDIDDRIGGTLQIVGTAGFPVVVTSLNDDYVPAGLNPDGQPYFDTNGDGLVQDGVVCGARRGGLAWDRLRRVQQRSQRGDR